MLILVIRISRKFSAVKCVECVKCPESSVVLNLLIKSINICNHFTILMVVFWAAAAVSIHQQYIASIITGEIVFLCLLFSFFCASHMPNQYLYIYFIEKCCSFICAINSVLSILLLKKMNNEKIKFFANKMQ